MIDYDNGLQILKPFCFLETPEIVTSVVWKNDNVFFNNVFSAKIFPSINYYSTS